MEFYKETKVAGGDCETPPGPTCRPGLGVLTTWPRVLGPQGLLGWALGKKGIPRKETMGGHLLPCSVTGGACPGKALGRFTFPWTPAPPTFSQANPPGLTGGRAGVTQRPMHWGQGLTQWAPRMAHAGIIMEARFC